MGFHCNFLLVLSLTNIRVCYANLNGFSWHFQLVLSIKNIGVLCKFIWVFMLVLGTHLLEYQSVYLANLNGFSWQFELVFGHQEYRSVYYANLNGF